MSETQTAPEPPVVAQDEPRFQDDQTPLPQADGGDDILVQWTAPEFVYHSKTPMWYLALAGATVVIAAVVWFITKDKLSTGAVIFVILLFGIYAARKPRDLEYAIETHGLTVGNKYRGYEEFRSFAIVPDGTTASVVFRPMKRFAQYLTLNLSPEVEEQVRATLSDRLPYDDKHHDPLDNFMNRIGF